MSAGEITIKKPTEIALIKQGGLILNRILSRLAKMAGPGVATADLEKAAEKMILESGGRPSFKGHREKNERPFPTVLCVSINDELVHAPSLPSRVLKEGDVVGIDVGMEWPARETQNSKPCSRMTLSGVKTQNLGFQKGFYTDAAVTVPVGRVSKEARGLIEATRRALSVGIRAIKPGRSVADIGRAIEQYAKKQKVGLVRDLVGHGVGYGVHEAPRIPNFFDPELAKIKIQKGMVLALEPMFSLGDWRVMTAPDGLTIKTVDGSLAAHFEHTVAVTEKGCEIMTKN